MPAMTTTAFEKGARNAAHDVVIVVDPEAVRSAPPRLTKKGGNDADVPLVIA
jgi:alcohol dehydrogenase class IV